MKVVLTDPFLPYDYKTEIVRVNAVNSNCIIVTPNQYVAQKVKEFLSVNVPVHSYEDVLEKPGFVRSKKIVVMDLDVVLEKIFGSKVELAIVNKG